MAPSAPIVVAFRPEEPAREPVEFGIAASRLTGAQLIIAAVRHGGAMVTAFAGEIDDSGSDAGRAIEHLRLDLRRRRIAADIRSVRENTLARALERVMADTHPMLVVLGMSGPSGIVKSLAGSTADRVIHSSDCPVAIVPKGYARPEGGVRVIGAAYAPTPEGREALRAAAALARAGGVRLKPILVLEDRHAGDQTGSLMAEQHHEAGREQSEAADRRLGAEAELREQLAGVAAGVDVEVDVLAQDPGEGLIAASRHVDMLVTGSRARGPKRAVLLGSVSRKLAAEAACPVLVIPRGTAEMTDKLVSATQAPA